MSDLMPHAWGDRYRLSEGVYKSLTLKIKNLVTDIIDEAGVDVVQIEARTKDVDSFVEKIERKKGQYKEPLTDITDLVGIRIIAYYQEDVSQICNLVEAEFDIDRDNSMDKAAILDPDRFGYVSVHYVASISRSRVGLMEWQPYAKIRFEIQVRTVLQHGTFSILITQVIGCLSCGVAGRGGLLGMASELRRVRCFLGFGVEVDEEDGVDGADDHGGFGWAASEFGEDLVGFELGVRAFGGSAQGGVGSVEGQPVLGQVLSLDRHDQRVAGADVALVGQCLDPDGPERFEDLVGSGGGQVVDRPGQRARDPQCLAFRTGDDLDVHAVMLVLSAVVGPVGPDPVDRDQSAVQAAEPELEHRVQRPAQRRRVPGGEHHAFLHVTPRGGHPDTEGRGQIREGLPFPQVDQHQQRLLAFVDRPVPRPDPPPMIPDQQRQPGPGQRGHVQTLTVEQHRSPSVDLGSWSIPHLPGASLFPQHDTPSVSIPCPHRMPFPAQPAHLHQHPQTTHRPARSR